MQISTQMMQMINASLREPGSALSRAMRALRDGANGSGTCLLLDHDDYGQAIIGDADWPLNPRETREHRDRLSVADLRDDAGSLRVAVLSAPAPDQREPMAGRGDFLMAALQTIEVVAEIAAQFAATMLPSDAVPDLVAASGRKNYV